MWIFMYPTGPVCLKVRYHYPIDKTLYVLLWLIHWIAIYPLDSIIHLFYNWALDINTVKHNMDSTSQNQLLFLIAAVLIPTIAMYF